MEAPMQSNPSISIQSNKITDSTAIIVMEMSLQMVNSEYKVLFDSNIISNVELEINNLSLTSPIIQMLSPSIIEVIVVGDAEVIISNSSFSNISSIGN